MTIANGLDKKILNLYALVSAYLEIIKPIWDPGEYDFDQLIHLVLTIDTALTLKQP